MIGSSEMFSPLNSQNNYTAVDCFSGGKKLENLAKSEGKMLKLNVFYKISLRKPLFCLLSAIKGHRTLKIPSAFDHPVFLKPLSIMLKFSVKMHPIVGNRTAAREPR